MERLSKGYTLIDCLVALSLLGILVAASIPSTSSIQASHILKGESENLLGLIRKLVTDSQSSEDDIFLAITTRTYDVTTAKGKKYFGAPQFLKNPVEFIQPIGTTRTISFYKTGVTTPSTIWLKTPRDSCKIRISLRGRIKTTC